MTRPAKAPSIHTWGGIVCTENDLLAFVYKGEEKKKSCLVFPPLRLKSFRAKLRCLRLACRSYEQPNRASDHMVVMALLESVCAATERPWYALCADPISGLGSENSKSVEGSKSMNVQSTFFSCIQTPNRSFSVQTTSFATLTQAACRLSPPPELQQGTQNGCPNYWGDERAPSQGNACWPSSPAAIPAPTVHSIENSAYIHMF